MQPLFGHRPALAAVLAASGLAACISPAGAGECGLVSEASLNAVLTTTSPNFYLSTPVAASEGSSSCQTEYDLTWRWADTTRAKTDTSQPPLTNLATIFRVVDDGHYYTYTETPQRSSTIPYTWSLTHSDHGTGTGATTAPFFIRTSLGSSAVVDSILISATIHYR